MQRSVKSIMRTVITSVILFLTTISSVHSYGYGLFGRGPWMAPFRPYLPSPFASPFTSAFAAGFGAGMPMGMPAPFPGFSMRRAGFSPIPAPAGMSPFGPGSPVGGISPFAAGGFGGYRFFPSSYPFTGFGPSAPAAFAPSPMPSMGSFASASRPQFSITKLGSTSSTSSGSR